MTSVDRPVHQVGPHVPAHVAVGDDADEALTLVEDADAAKPLAGNLDHRRRHFGFDRDARDALALMHDVAHQHQFGAELAAGVEHAEIERGESLALHQRDRQRVAQHKLQRRRSRRREAVRAGLLDLRQRRGEYRPRGRACSPLPRSWRSAAMRIAPGVSDDGGELRRLAGPGNARARHRRSAPCQDRRGWLRPDGRKSAGRPVEARVAAILRATWPDFPMPVTMTRPGASAIVFTASSKAAPRLSGAVEVSAASSDDRPWRATPRVRRAEAMGDFDGAIHARSYHRPPAIAPPCGVPSRGRQVWLSGH